MPLPVGSVPSPGSAPTGGSTGGLQAQLEEAARQLADCLTCATAHTTEGQARIQRLTARVQALRSRIAQGTTQPREVPSAPAARPASPLGQALDLRG